MAEPTTTEAQTTNEVSRFEKEELFDHLLYYLYNDCHVYAQTHKGDAFYESLEDCGLLGKDHEATLEIVRQQAELLADFIQDIRYHEAFPHGIPRSE